MLTAGGEDLQSAPKRAIGKSFRKIGWLGFWTQVFVAIIPILVFSAIFAATRGFSLPGGRMDVLGWFSLLSVLILAFTTFWSWRYRTIGRRLESGEAALDPGALSKTVWTGLAASSFGVLLSLVVVLAEVVYLLLVFLEAPQGGAPVFQTVDGAGPSWITALDLLSLLALILTASAEIVTLLLALWLLFRISALPDGAESASTDAAAATA
jgi:uncharacterized membrane protein